MCDEDPRGRVCKIQTFVRGDSWEPQFPTGSGKAPRSERDEADGNGKYAMCCKLCKQRVVVHAEKLDPVLDLLAANGIHKINLANLAFAIKQMSEGKAQGTR
jgi:hypothetical protein